LPVLLPHSTALCDFLELLRQHRSEEAPHLGLDIVLAADDVGVAVAVHPDALIFVQLELALDVAPVDVVVDRGSGSPVIA
jgi:hypothetical protein